MHEYKNTKEAIEDMKFEYLPCDFQNDCGYTPLSWEEVETLLINGQKLHTFVGDWEYYRLLTLIL